MSELDLDTIERRWSADGGTGNPRSADDYTEAGCRVFAQYAFAEVPTLVARIRELEAEIVRRKVINTLSRMKADIDPDDPTAIEAWRETTIGWKERCELAEAEAARVRELTPRVLEGDWETVRDALDALPEGAQIRWTTGDPVHVALAIKYTNVLGNGRWDATGSGLLLRSETIARDETPIEVIA
ncbi:hypothetical protein CH249_25900 [Rhodococcus sp. 05-2255-3B1]|uniref:hypothetical protein n=1 Tax=Rhodococcus sp. 05-2255-3B1 TaxID=2022482 RepID=UPI000B9BD853|nr:hypothetical protein [Rhodococcus sp. 05-2255-3B1]OZE04369.1 hypothetical protein CH249_25900 [Rhodococcus sp. 05-2255-3B1]